MHESARGSFPDETPSHQQLEYHTHLQTYNESHQTHRKHRTPIPGNTSSCNEHDLLQGSHSQHSWQGHYNWPHSTISNTDTWGEHASHHAQHVVTVDNQAEADMVMSTPYLNIDLMRWSSAATPPPQHPLDFASGDMMLSTDVSEAISGGKAARVTDDEILEEGCEVVRDTEVVATSREVNESGFETALHALMSLSTNMHSSSVAHQPVTSVRGNCVREGTMTNCEQIQQLRLAPNQSNLTDKTVTASTCRESHHDHENTHYDPRHFKVHHDLHSDSFCRDTAGALDVFAANGYSPIDTINHIRHYRYKVAPWVCAYETKILAAS